jgi:GNAT superfamily N-acetyltransferase
MWLHRASDASADDHQCGSPAGEIPSMNIDYRDNAIISALDAIDLYRRSTLGERRPVDRPDLFDGMLKNSDLVVSAWSDSRLVGIARTLTDFNCVAYLADLAVDLDFQKQGIGKRLIEITRQHLKPECMMVLLAAPKANEYYAKLGFEHNPRAWVRRGD